MKNKAKRLLVPYVFVASIWVVPISLVFFKWDFEYLAKKYILCINPSQLWFLWMLFGVFVLIWPIRKAMIERALVGWTIALVFYGIGITGKMFLPNMYCIWTACQYIVFFYIGMRIRTKEEKEEKRISEYIQWYVWFVADLVLFIACFLIYRYQGVVWRILYLGFTLALHIVGAIMAWTTLQKIADRVKWVQNKKFTIILSCSMPMYLFHQQIIYFTLFFLNGKVNPLMHAGVNYVVALCISFLISKELMQWKTTRFLIGEK